MNWEYEKKNDLSCALIFGIHEKDFLISLTFNKSCMIEYDYKKTAQYKI